MDLDQNPMLCGCSNKKTGAPCWRIDASNTITTSTQPACATSKCVDVTFDLSYEWTDGMRGVYDVTVGMRNQSKHTVQLLQYQLGNPWNYSRDYRPPTAEEERKLNQKQPVSAALVSSSSGVGSEYKTDTLSANNAYSVCVTLASDLVGQHRMCQYLTPPYYMSSSVSYTAPLSLLVLPLLLATAL